MSKYTPAPWEFIPSFSGYGYSTLISTSTNKDILCPTGINDGDSPIVWMGEELSDADRRLICAAPELLEALETFVKLEENDIYVKEPYEITMNMARAAIKKARGD